MDGLHTGVSPPTETLAGLVERVTFHNAETGLCVLRVKAWPPRTSSTDPPRPRGWRP